MATSKRLCCPSLRTPEHLAWARRIFPLGPFVADVPLPWFIGPLPSAVPIPRPLVGHLWIITFADVDDAGFFLATSSPMERTWVIDHTDVDDMGFCIITSKPRRPTW